jgi:LAO/AO transport system kinase
MTVTPVRRGVPDLAELAAGIRAGNRAMLARAITLVESRRHDHAEAAHRLVQDLLPETGRAIRLGMTGVPGAGKSTTIDALGTMLTGEGLRVAVLAVDPSSGVTGGSILGDKTRMARLAHDAKAFIRPSPSSGTLGGVAERTRECMLICEAAGFDVIIVETVGVGQSETAVRDMVDFFMVLMVPGTGDDLQGIKKGVLELADMIAVNKADGDGRDRARRAAGDYRAALNILTQRDPDWIVPVTLISGLTGDGLAEAWGQVLRHRDIGRASGAFQRRRAEQQVKWFWTLIEDRMSQWMRRHPAIRGRLKEIESAVGDGRLSVAMAVDEVSHALGLIPSA